MGKNSLSENLSPSAEEEMDEALERWNSFAEIERQKREWDKGVRNPSLMKKAESIIAELGGRRFTLDSLAEKHFYIYSHYLILAAKKAGYRLEPDLMKFPWFLYQVEKFTIGGQSDEKTNGRKSSLGEGIR